MSDTTKGCKPFALLDTRPIWIQHSMTNQHELLSLKNWSSMRYISGAAAIWLKQSHTARAICSPTSEPLAGLRLRTILGLSCLSLDFASASQPLFGYPARENRVSIWVAWQPGRGWSRPMLPCNLSHSHEWQHEYSVDREVGVYLDVTSSG